MNAKQKAFWKLTPAKQRIAIAKDVIRQMAAKRLKPKLDNGYVVLKKRIRDQSENQLCDVLAGQPCTVCALGAMMVTAVQQANKLKVIELDSYYHDELSRIDQDDCLVYLKQFFEREQLDFIEAAFEGWDNPNSDWGDKRSKFAPRLRSASARMTAVMENIIKNKGTFVWPETP